MWKVYPSVLPLTLDSHSAHGSLVYLFSVCSCVIYRLLYKLQKETTICRRSEHKANILNSFKSFRTVVFVSTPSLLCKTFRCSQQHVPSLSDQIHGDHTVGLFSASWIHTMSFPLCTCHIDSMSVQLEYERKKREPAVLQTQCSNHVEFLSSLRTVCPGSSASL